MNNNINTEGLVELLTRHLKYRPEIEEMRENAIERNIPVIQKETADLIRLLIRTSNTKSILEIGTAIGYSTCLFYETMKTGRITTIEKRHDCAVEAADNFERLGYSNIDLIEGDALACISKAEGPFDMIFIDAAKSHYKSYFDQAFPLLKEGGVIVSDNILMNGLTLNYDMKVRKNRTMVRAMRSYIEFICNNNVLTTSLIPIGDGLAVSHYIKEK